MLRLRYRWHAACPRHPRYSPLAGEGAIKGGCPFCRQLWRTWEAARKLEAEMNHWEELLDSRRRLIELPVRRRG